MTEHPICLDTHTLQAVIGRKRVDLTITEFELLSCLLENVGRYLSRNDLLNEVWDETYMGTERTVDTHIQRLRKKLGEAAYLIKTVREVGYRLVKLEDC